MINKYMVVYHLDGVQKRKYFNKLIDAKSFCDDVKGCVVSISRFKLSYGRS